MPQRGRVELWASRRRGARGFDRKEVVRPCVVIVVLVVGFAAYCRRWQVAWVGLGTPLQVMNRAFGKMEMETETETDTEGLALVAEYGCDLKCFSMALVVGC